MKTLACYSIKGGVGKTASSVNLAYLAAESGLSTLLIDLDPQGASSFYFRVKPSRHAKAKTLLNKHEDVERAIKATDYPNLDILPASESFRNLDLVLDGQKKSERALKGVIKAIGGEYDLVVLDCPPNLTLLSENVLHSAQAIVVPMVPTPLSQRTYVQLKGFMQSHGLKTQRLLPYFSMVQVSKSIHKEVMEAFRENHPETLSSCLLFASVVERMGLTCEPVPVFAPNTPACQAYRALWDELSERLFNKSAVT